MILPAFRMVSGSARSLLCDVQPGLSADMMLSEPLNREEWDTEKHWSFFKDKIRPRTEDHSYKSTGKQRIQTQRSSKTMAKIAKEGKRKCIFQK